jgi:phage baseplate assembly protein gpV
MRQTADIYSPDIVEIIQTIIRNELKKLWTAEVGVVTKLYPHESGSDKNNYECDVKLRDSGLELPRVPVATQRIGHAAIPNVDDLVMVQFIKGSLRGAVITGRFYNDADRPPEAKAKEFVYICPDAAESGVRRVYLEFPNGNTLLIDDDKVILEAGDTKLNIKNSGEVEIKSNAKIVIQSQGNTEVSSQGDMKLETAGSLSIKAQADVTIEGLTVSMKGQTSAQIEGQASTTVKGPMISIAGMTSFSPS